MCSIRSNWIRPGLGARLRGSDLAGLQFSQKTRKLGTARLIAPALDPITRCGLLLPPRIQFGPPSPWRTTRRYDWDKSPPSRNQISHYYATLTKPIVEHVTIPPALKPILHRPEPFPPPQSVIDGGKIVSSTLTVGNMTRTVHFYVPNESYLSRRKHGEIPLLIAFHGATEQGLLFRASSSSFAYDDLACKEAYIIAYPDAYKGNWNDGRVNVNYPAALEDIDDISFTKAIISHAQDTLGTDPNKTLMTGYSNGGQFILRMLFEETAPVIAGIAVHCVSLPEQENNKIKMVNSNKSRIPIIFVNGVADPVNPYEGGKLILVRLANGKTLGDRGLHMGAQRTAKFLASNWKDAEYLDRTREVDRGVARRQEWRDNGRPVLRLISMEGEGHHVPVPGGSKMPLFLGPALEKLHAPQEVINFFKDATDALSLETTTPKDTRLSISQHFKSINVTLSLLSIVFATYLLT